MPSQQFAADIVRTTRAAWKQQLASKQEQERQMGQNLWQLAGQAEKHQPNQGACPGHIRQRGVGGHRSLLKQE